ncbi:XRE family transcriptional regulator [Limibacterium fermenti]|uniref:XRE family transcriptional regulator n=1 Tax=Limibacterium fermenti TaxID=3229863 RepID=UPI003A77829A
MELAEKLNKKYRSIYVQVAEKFGVTPRYVWQIAKGERKATRGKGAQVKEYLIKLAES